MGGVCVYGNMFTVHFIPLLAVAKKKKEKKNSFSLHLGMFLQQQRQFGTNRSLLHTSRGREMIPSQRILLKRFGSSIELKIAINLNRLTSCEIQKYIIVFMLEIIIYTYT